MSQEAPLTVLPTPPENPAREPVCIIGNSYVGALYRASVQGLVENPSHRLAFFARAGERFDAIRPDGTILTGFTVTSGESPDLREYAQVVIYADMPNPLTARDLMREMAAAGYSSRVCAAAMRDRVRTSRPMRLAARIAPVFSGPIHILASNLALGQRIAHAEELAEASGLLAAAVAPFAFVPPPATLFDPDGWVDPRYHAGSLDISGAEPDRTLQPDHAVRHYNEAGGALVLGALFGQIGADQRGAKLASSSSSQATSSAAG